MKNITVDVRLLERAYSFDLHEFKDGGTYPLSKLMTAMGFSKGTPQGRSRGNTKQEDAPAQARDQPSQQHSVRIIHLEEEGESPE